MQNDQYEKLRQDYKPDVTYGGDAVLQLLKTEDYRQCFGKLQEEIYEEWVEYIKNYRQ